MAYIETISLDAADRIDADREKTRLPYFIAVPIWLSLAILAWSPIIVLIRALTA